MHVELLRDRSKAVKFNSGAAAAAGASASTSAKAGRARAGGRRPARERLVELNELLEASLITEYECRAKREQILAEF